MSKNQTFLTQAFGAGFRCPTVDACDNLNHHFFILVILDPSSLLDTVDRVVLLTHHENVLAIDRYSLKSLFSFHSIRSRCPRHNLKIQCSSTIQDKPLPISQAI